MSGRRALALMAIGWAAATLVRAAVPMGPGLRGQYFLNAQWVGPAAISALDSTISTRQIARRWRFRVPDAFSAQWSGYLTIERPGLYIFATTSDDGSKLFVDGQLVVDNGGPHGPITRQGQVRLDRGPHVVLLQYFQDNGPYVLEWSWAHEQESLTPVPGRVLSPRPRSPAMAFAAASVEWFWRLLTLAGLLLAARVGYKSAYWKRWMAANSDVFVAADATRPWSRAGLLCLLLFVALACVHTWPLVTDPAHLSRNDNADAMLNEWTVAWVAHQLPRAPQRLFDANIFYPDRGTLAYSEAMILQGMAAVPLFWLGASPVLAYNILLLTGFALTGWTMCLIVARWTGDWVAGIASGILVAFNAHTLTRLPHLQAHHVEFLPLALLSLDALLRRPRWSSAFAVALWLTLQTLTSVYLLAFTALALVVAVLARPEDWLGTQRFLERAPKLATAALVSAVTSLPFLLPYWRLHEQGFVRSLDDIARYSATARDYLTTPSRILGWAGHAGGGDTGLYPGLVGLTLVAAALASRVAFRDRRARMCLAFGVVGVVLSFGPATPGYAFLYSAFPLLQAVRAAARFGYLGLVAVAILAGYGMAWLRPRVGGGSLRAAASVSILSLLVLEPLAAPVRYRRFEGIPSIYGSIRSDAGAVVVDVPFEPPFAVSRNAAYMLNSTLNMKPLLNGYSGFVPPSYNAHYEQLRGFPVPESIRALQELGVRYVFAHLDRMDAETAAAIARVPALNRRAGEGPIVLYELEPAAR